MADHDAERLLQAVRDRLRDVMESSPKAAALMRALGEWIIAEADQALPAAKRIDDSPKAPPAAPSSPAPSPAPAAPRAAGAVPTSTGIVPLKLGDLTIHVPVQGTSSEIGRARAAAHGAEAAEAPPAAPLAPADDLKLISRRCRLKAESCRLYTRRRAAAADPVQEPRVLEEMNAMLTEAKSIPGCFLWVFWRHAEQPSDTILADIAGCYEGVAEACDLLLAADPGHEGAVSETTSESMQLLALCTSALRVVLMHTWLTAPDADQEASHSWLRRQSAYRRVYIARHMRLDDGAKIEDVPGARARIAALKHAVDERAKSGKKVASLVSTIRYHAKRVAAAGQAEANDLKKACDALAALDELGVPATDDRVLEALGATTLEQWAGEHEGRARLDRALHAAGADAARDDDEPDDPAVPRAWSPRVLELRETLRGTSIVMIGGERRQQAVDRIRDAFQLDDVEWIRLNEHASGAPMAAPIARASTSLVVVLIKLTGHLHAEEATEYARKAGKPCVFLKAGYNPEQIAEATLAQAGLTLKRDSREEVTK